MITDYKDEQGNTLYKVVINIRGRFNPTLRFRRQTLGIKTLDEAVAEEKKLFRFCEKKMAEKEMNGQKLSALIDRWAKHTIYTRVASGEVSEAMVTSYRSIMLDWLKPHLGTPASFLTAYMVTEIARQKRAEGYSISQLTKFRCMIRSIYEFGSAYGIIPKGTKTPTPEFKFARTKEFVPEILSTDEILKLVDEAIRRKHPWRHIWAAALLTGMRSGELLALSWQDVDLDKRMMRVSKSYELSKKIIKSTKAGYWRDVPIGDDLMRVLEELRPITGQGEFVLPRIANWETGTQAHVLRSFCKEIGITSIRFHTLRACFATQLLRSGVEAVKVMKVCGWRDLSTMQRYVRYAGIEVMGVTDKISVLPPIDPTQKVVSLRGL